MLKKHIYKILIIILCFAFLPITLLSNSEVKASQTATILSGTEYMYYTSDEIKSAESGTVIIKVKLDGETTEEVIYGYGVIEREEDKTISKNVTNVRYTNGYVILVFKNVENNYVITTSVKDTEIKHEQQIHVTNNSANLTKPSYVSSGQNYDAFITALEDVYKNDENENIINAGDSFTIPMQEFEALIDTTSLGFRQYEKKLYVVAPGSKEYAVKSTISIENTSTELSFSTTLAGKYRFYVTLESDVIYDDVKFSILNDGLVEVVDGMLLDGTPVSGVSVDGLYRAKKGSAEVVAVYENGEYKYTLKDDEDTKVEASEIDGYEFVIPTFTFEVGGDASDVTQYKPTVEYKGKSQENGYVGLSYTISTFNVTGNEVKETYTLMYSQSYDENDASVANWEVVEDGFDAINMKFTPTKIGYYKVVLEVEDNYDNEVVSAESLVISVLSEPTTPKYKTSFAEWIKVNTLPFVLLCISFVSFVAILCLLFIKPSNKSAKIEEEDR